MVLVKECKAFRDAEIVELQQSQDLFRYAQSRKAVSTICAAGNSFAL